MSVNNMSIASTSFATTFGLNYAANSGYNLSTTMSLSKHMSSLGARNKFINYEILIDFWLKSWWGRFEKVVWQKGSQFIGWNWWTWGWLGLWRLGAGHEARWGLWHQGPHKVILYLIYYLFHHFHIWFILSFAIKIKPSITIKMNW